MRRQRVKGFGFLRRIWLRSRWEIVAVAAVVALLLGWSGFDELARRGGEPEPAYNSLYKALCLFVFEGGDLDGVLPVRLQIARFTAPLVVAIAAVGAAMAVLHSEVQRFVAHWIVRNHVIVVGLGGRGLELSRQMVANGYRCVIVDVVDTAPESTRARLLGIPVVVTSGEPDVDLMETDLLADVLHRAGVHRSVEVVVMTGSPALDARFAHVLYSLQERSGATFQAFVEMDDIDGLRNMLGSQVEVGDGALEWFSLTDRAARSLLDQLGSLLSADGETDRHLIVVGATPLGRSLIVQMARNWSREQAHLRNGRGSGRLVLTMIEPATGSEADWRQAAEELLWQLRRRDPRVPSASPIKDPPSPAGELRVDMWDMVRTPIVDVLGSPSPSVVIITADDDHELLRRATEVTTTLPRSMPVWLCSEQSGGIVDIVTGPRGDGGDLRKVEVFHVLDTVVREDEIRRGVDEELARAVHRAHCWRQNAAANRSEDSETTVPWDDLADDVRTLNYVAVGAWRNVLKAHGYHLTPYSTPGAENVELPEMVLDDLAAATHRSWSAAKQRQGFRHGEQRNDDPANGPLTHPEIGVPFDELPEAGQKWNYDQARAVPEHLAAADLQLYPLPAVSHRTGEHEQAVELSPRDVERLAKALHKLYGENIDVKLDDAEGVGLLSWAALSDQQRESNRATARSFPSILGRLGYVLQPARGVPHAATVLTDDEIERLAVVEHDRWAREKKALGYVYGARRCDDADPPTHPDLVGWDKLTDHARNKDRVRIVEAPRLLADIGYELVRARVATDS